MIVNFDAYFIPVNVSVDENKREKLFSIYPNPSHNILTVQSAENENSELILEIKDLAGKTLKPEKLKMMNGKCNISVQELPASMYILSVRNNQKLSEQYRFVKMN